MDDTLPEAIPQPYRQPRGREAWQPKSEWEWEDFPIFHGFLDSLPAHPERTWYADFLKHLATYGEKAAAAMYVRVGISTLYRAFEDDPAFKAETQAALDFYRSRCRHALMHNTRTTGNPVGAIVTNKAEEPAKYIEKHAVVSLSMTAEVPGLDVQAVLQQMLGSHQLLAQPPALPETTEP